MTWYFWKSVIEFSLVYGLFGMAIYVNLAAGLLSFAPIAVGAIAGFFAAGLYDVTGMSPYLLLLIGAISGVAVSALFFEILKRLASHYLAMASLALVLLVQVIILNAEPWTGGVRGRVVEFGVETWEIAIATVLILILMQRLRGSALWLSFSALRADVDVAAGIGVNRVRTQRVSFWLSGGIAGTAGVLYAGALQYLDPETFGVSLAFLALPAAVLGGTFHWAGPMVGAFLLEAIPGLFSSIASAWVQVAVGTLILLMVLFLPGGVVSDSWLVLLRRLGLPRPKHPMETETSVIPTVKEGGH